MQRALVVHSIMAVIGAAILTGIRIYNTGWRVDLLWTAAVGGAVLGIGLSILLIGPTGGKLKK